MWVSGGEGGRRAGCVGRVHFPLLCCFPAVGQPTEDSLISLRTPLPMDFEMVRKMTFCWPWSSPTCPPWWAWRRQSGLSSLAGDPPWEAVGGSCTNLLLINGQNIFNVHRAITTNRYVVHLYPSIGDTCPFYSQKEMVRHLFAQWHSTRLGGKLCTSSLNSYRGQSSWQYGR